MSTEINGGPAFPVVLPHSDEGMTLRDYFAAAALTGILGSRNGFMVDCGTDNVAGWAYGIADKMLAERQKVAVEE